MTLPVVAVTGAEGFLGWHLRCRLRATRGLEVMAIGREHFADQGRLQDAINQADVVVHLAGVNRAPTSEMVQAGNIELASKVSEALMATSSSAHVIYANSIQASGSTPYGIGKLEAGELLAKATKSLDALFSDIWLPNLFGEHGRPQYNSFVSTFCHGVTTGGPLELKEDREVPLLHAQRAAETIANVIAERIAGRVDPTGVVPRTVSSVLQALREFHGLYMRGEIPVLTDEFTTDLFNTYRSYLFPEHFPLFPNVHTDARGGLYEALRCHGGTGQVYVSSTLPDAVRGDHYHLHKVERFLVMAGEAEIRLRRLFYDDVATFRVSGERPAIIDMPTMWVHNIRNVGTSELLTMFWSDQLLDRDNPDQYAERVGAGGMQG